MHDLWSRLPRTFGLYRPESDPFIRRIRSLVIGEGMLHEGNIRLMDHAIRHMPAAGNVVEIGSYGGLSANVITYLLEKHQKSHPFFTCDAWIYEGYQDHLQAVPTSHIDGREDIPRQAFEGYIKNAFMESVRFLSPQRIPHAFHLYSDVFFEKWNSCRQEMDIFGRTAQLGGEISFAYIDGGHSHEVAWHDFTQAAAHLTNHGFILLDDSAEGKAFGSARMMTAIKKDPRFRVVAKKPNYLIQKIS